MQSAQGTIQSATDLLTTQWVHCQLTDPANNHNPTAATTTTTTRKTRTKGQRANVAHRALAVNALTFIKNADKQALWGSRPENEPRPRSN